MTPVFVKDPDARMDYAVDWGPFLASTPGDAILTATWVDVPDELTVSDEGYDLGLHVAFVSGGQPMHTYRLTSRITTEQGRVQDDTLVLFIQHT